MKVFADHQDAQQERENAQGKVEFLRCHVNPEVQFFWRDALEAPSILSWIVDYIENRDCAVL